MTTRQQINEAANDLVALIMLIRNRSDEEIDQLLDTMKISLIHDCLHAELKRSREIIQMVGRMQRRDYNET